MDELIQQITTRTGISDDQARQATEMVMSFVKTKLPEPIASQVDGLMSGGDMMGQVQQQMGNLGGMFGGNL